MLQSLRHDVFVKNSKLQHASKPFQMGRPAAPPDSRLANARREHTRNGHVRARAYHGMTNCMPPALILNGVMLPTSVEEQSLRTTDAVLKSFRGARNVRLTTDATQSATNSNMLLPFDCGNHTSCRPQNIHTQF